MNLSAILRIAAIAVLASAASRARAADPAIEIVESVPVETMLDHPDIRNTPAVWLEMIEGARKTLDIAQFYVANEPGEPLEKIIRAVQAAAARGVKVRIIADAKYQKIYPETLDLLGKDKNVSMRTIDMDALTKGVMHAKYFIVDGERVFLGSANFDWRALKHIRELGVRVDHAAFARVVSDLFDLDWALCEAEDPESAKKRVKSKAYKAPFKVSGPGGQPVELTPVFSPTGLIPDEELFAEKHILRLLDGAKKEILVQVPGYNPVERNGEFYPALDNALRRAAARGVKVKMIASDWNTRPPRIHHLKSLAVLPDIEVKLNTIPMWSQGYVPFARMEHLKMLVADKSAAWIGSSNWSKGYFHSSRNLGVIVEGEAVVSILRKFFFTGWMGPYTYFIEPQKEYIPPQRGD
ncbi:MAG: phospholipase D-like domain-containing protein [Elusimicrobiota bacterium]